MNVAPSQFKHGLTRLAALAAVFGLISGCAAYDPYYGGKGTYYGKSYSSGYPYYGKPYASGYPHYGHSYGYGYRYGYPYYPRRHHAHSTFSYYFFGFKPHRHHVRHHHSRGHRSVHGGIRFPATTPRRSGGGSDDSAVDELRRITRPPGSVPRDAGRIRSPGQERHAKSETRPRADGDAARRQLQGIARPTPRAAAPSTKPRPSSAPRPAAKPSRPTTPRPSSKPRSSTPPRPSSKPAPSRSPSPKTRPRSSSRSSSGIDSPSKRERERR